MSQENVELVRRAFEAVRRGDYQGATRGFHADAVWHNTVEFPGPATCVGPQAIIDFWETLVESFEESRMDIERVVEGENSVVLRVHSVAQGRAGAVPVNLHWAMAFHVRGSKIRRVDVHGDWAKALEAVGLAE
jgi:ketosteroid isomerase-like protein